MFVLGRFLGAVSVVSSILLTILQYLIIARALISFVNPDPYNAIVQFLYRTTEPILKHIRRVIPPMGGLDFSPLVALLTIIFLQYFLIGTLDGIVSRLG